MILQHPVSDDPYYPCEKPIYKFCLQHSKVYQTMILHHFFHPIILIDCCSLQGLLLADCTTCSCYHIFINLPFKQDFSSNPTKPFVQTAPDHSANTSLQNCNIQPSLKGWSTCLSIWLFQPTLVKNNGMQIIHLTVMYLCSYNFFLWKGELTYFRVHFHYSSLLHVVELMYL